MLKKLLLAGAALALSVNVASAKELKSIGISLGSLGNPFFIALKNGAEFEAKKVNPDVKITTVGYDYDLGKQNTQIDNFIAAGVDLILLNPGDPNAIAPAIKRAQKAGIIVVSVDTHAKGANATVETNNVQAGTIACEFLIDKMGGKGNMLIINGPQVSSVIERVKGCDAVVAKHPGIKILSQDQDAKGSRDGGLAIGQSLLTRFDKVDGAFAINDPTGVGFELAAKQLKRTIPLTAVDGSPDAEAALKDPEAPNFLATSSQDPFLMARLAVQVGTKILGGGKPDKEVQLMDSKLVTRDNVKEYQGWSAH